MILTVGNTKGGVGKTTISINLAVEASREGKKVLLIDTDSQASAVDFRKERKNDDITAIALVSNKVHLDVNRFEKLFDLIIIDAGGSDNDIFRSALAACKFFLMPVKPGQLDVWAVGKTIKAFCEIQPFNQMKGRIVFNMAQPNTKIFKKSQAVLEAYRDDLPILEQLLQERVGFGGSIEEGQGVSEYEPRGIAAQEMQNLYRAIMAEMEKMYEIKK